ncbi:unnamed protein product [Acanthoscelides obtectus]|uniref:Uncharacterized protein n=1 Tax=Acanthoscelides obtectus TaxID=200917 RepID=A0A9P0JYH2_ACAOB|nr:unnamed protein product [Acanthoscelides obtectus]CAK1632041.1 hypothetical protein AOBTE_LOCUS7321 [Acanthoscelides obtectus]
MYPSVNTAGSYSKYRAKLQTKSGQGAKRVKEYNLTPHLLFLDPFLKSRKSKGNIAEESALSADEETDANEYEENGNIEVQSPDYILSAHSSHSPIPSPSTFVDDHLLAMKAPETPSRKGDDLKKKKLATSINNVNQAYQYFEKKQKVLEI